MFVHATLSLSLCLIGMTPPDKLPGAAERAAEAETEAPADATEPPALTGPAAAEEIEVLPENQQDRKTAEALYKSGETAYGEGRHDEAVEFFAEAYKNYPSNNLLYSLGSAHRKIYEARDVAAHRRFAILRYSQYLRNDERRPDSDPEKGKYEAEAQRYMSALLAQSELGGVDEKAVITRVMISTTAEDAWMTIDDGEPTPAPGVATVEPGSHTIVVGGEGYDNRDKTVNVPEGATVQVELEPAPMPAMVTVTGPRGGELAIDGRTIGKLPLMKPVAVTPGVHFVSVAKNGRVAYTRQVEVGRAESITLDAEMRNSTQRVLSYTMIGLGGAGVVTSAILMGFAFRSQNKAQDIDKQREDDQISEGQYASYLDHIDRRDALRTAAIATGAVGGGLLVTGFVLFAFDRPQVDVPLFDRERRTASFTAAPFLSPDGAGAMARIRF